MPGTTEFRIRCSALGEPGHRLHAWPVSARNAKNPEQLQKLLDNRNADPAMDGLPFYAGCKPYRIDARTIGPWLEREMQ